VVDREEIAQLLEREQIRELATRYSFAVDRHDFETVASLFDEEVDNGRWGKGREATKAFYENLLGRAGDGTAMHHVANHQIDFVDADHASGMCYVRAVAGIGDRWIEAVACYIGGLRQARRALVLQPSTPRRPAAVLTRGGIGNRRTLAGRCRGNASPASSGAPRQDSSSYLKMMFGTSWTGDEEPLLISRRERQ
jgi:hypothetical protein